MDDETRLKRRAWRERRAKFEAKKNAASNGDPPAPEIETGAHDSDTPAVWERGGPSPNPKGRPVQPKTAKEVRALARQHTTAMVETLARVAKNPKAPFAARQAAASSLLDRAWGKPASLDLEGAEQLVIRVVKLADEPENEIKTIEHIPDEGEQ